MVARSRATLTAALGVAAVLTMSACGAGLEPRAPQDAAAPTGQVPASPGIPEGAEGDPTTTTTAAGTPSDGTTAVLQDTVERTGAAESGRYEMVVTYDTAAAGVEPVAPMRATGEFADQGRAVRLEMAAGGTVGTIEQVIVDGIAYVTVPGVGCQQIDLTEMLDAFGPMSGGAMDPGAYLEQLRAVGGDVVEEGVLDVRGVPTTHYSAAYSVREALATLPEDQSEALDELYTGMPSSFLDAEQAVDVFVDDEGLLRRMQVESTSVDVEGLALPATTTIMDWFDFGADVTIEAPSDCEAAGVAPFGTDDLLS